MNFREAVQPFAEEPLTKQLLLHLLKDFKRPYDKINELVKKGELMPVKNGFYIPGPALTVQKPESFLIANHLWGPSYISLETALSWWGLIPEKVYEVVSVTVKAAKTYKTPAGRFSYFHASLPWYSFGVKSVPLTPKQVALVASPEKALCDKIVFTAGVLLRSIRQVLAFLLEDLRLDEEALHQLNKAEISFWLSDAPKKSSLEMLVKTLNNL